MLGDSFDVTTDASEIWLKYLAIGGSGSLLRAPVTDENCGLKDWGCFQHFQDGSIYFSQGAGTHYVKGAIKDQWARQGWENGRLGYPTMDENCGLRSRGCFQTFQGGSIYFSPDSAAHTVLGAIRDRWGSMGWENGFLGYPITSEVCGLAKNGCYQKFQGGHIYWSSPTGAWPVVGEIFNEYSRNGWEWGRYGYPLEAERCGPARCEQRFEGGVIVFIR